MTWFRETPESLAALEAERATLAALEDVTCHCGQPVAYGFDGDPTHHRGMCAHCDAFRCDAYPGECGR